MIDGPTTGFAFVIDTDSYAGNFEREMTAYLTGQIGECKVGKEFIEKLPIENTFESNIQQVADEHGCFRPTTCAPEPSTANPKIGFPYGEYKSVAIFFYDIPTQKEIDMMKERAYEFDHVRKNKNKSWGQKGDIKILGFRMVEFGQSQIAI